MIMVVMDKIFILFLFYNYARRNEKRHWNGTEMWQLNLFTRRFRYSIFLLAKKWREPLDADPAAYVLLVLGLAITTPLLRRSSPFKDQYYSTRLV